MAASPASERRIFPIVTLIVVAGATAAMLWRGWSYYKLGIDARVDLVLDHPEFKPLKQTGFIGLGYGFAGAALVFLNLLYLARRKVTRLRALGSMKFWLDLHVFTGLLAAVFVAFHSTFVLRNQLATTAAASLGIAVLTGIIGRFLYALVPSSDEQPLLLAIHELENRLPGTEKPIRAAIDAFPAPTLPPTAGLIRSLVAVPGWRRVARHRREAVLLVVAPMLAPLDRRHRRHARRALRVVEKLSAADVRAGGSAALLRSWRSLHRLFALIMLVTVAVHVGVAWHYGYRWVFSR